MDCHGALRGLAMTVPRFKCRGSWYKIAKPGRGTTADDDALIAALQSGRVAAAGLDVFNNEPAIHPGYLALENVVLLPHIGSATVETRNAMGFLALDGIAKVLGGSD
jgi:lactate dehydrogenase-like 2-hydroxyacid dehydrogenase